MPDSILKPQAFDLFRKKKKKMAAVEIAPAAVAATVQPTIIDEVSSVPPSPSVAVPLPAAAEVKVSRKRRG